MTPDSELDRQLRAVRAGETETIVCPWCGSFCNEASGDCCLDMAEAKDHLAVEHLKSLQRQFSGVRSGTRDSVQCPYCGGINRAENLESPAHWKRPNISPYCCPLMDVACARLTEQIAVQKQIDHKRRIEDNVARVSVN